MRSWEWTKLTIRPGHSMILELEYLNPFWDLEDFSPMSEDFIYLVMILALRTDGDRFRFHPIRTDESVWNCENTN